MIIFCFEFLEHLLYRKGSVSLGKKKDRAQTAQALWSPGINH